MVQGLAFLSKKSWHTKNLANQEKVWIAEERKKVEEQKTKELAKQIQQEREQEQLDAITGGGGNKKRNLDRGIDWMYQGQNPQSEIAKEDEAAKQEEFLLGKVFTGGGGVVKGDLALANEDDQGVNKVIGATVAAAASIKEPPSATAATSSFVAEPSVTERNEAFRKRHEDPMFSVAMKAVEKQRNMERKKELFERVTGKMAVAVDDRRHNQAEGDVNNENDDDIVNNNHSLERESRRKSSSKENKKVKKRKKHKKLKYDFDDDYHRGRRSRHRNFDDEDSYSSDSRGKGEDDEDSSSRGSSRRRRRRHYSKDEDYNRKRKSGRDHHHSSYASHRRRGKEDDSESCSSYSDNSAKESHRRRRCAKSDRKREGMRSRSHHSSHHSKSQRRRYRSRSRSRSLSRSYSPSPKKGRQSNDDYDGKKKINKTKRNYDHGGENRNNPADHREEAYYGSRRERRHSLDRYSNPGGGENIERFGEEKHSTSRGGSRMEDDRKLPAKHNEYRSHNHDNRKPPPGINKNDGNAYGSRCNHDGNRENSDRKPPPFSSQVEAEERKKAGYGLQGEGKSRNDNTDYAKRTGTTVKLGPDQELLQRRREEEEEKRSRIRATASTRRPLTAEEKAKALREMQDNATLREEAKSAAVRAGAARRNELDGNESGRTSGHGDKDNLTDQPTFLKEVAQKVHGVQAGSLTMRERISQNINKQQRKGNSNFLT